MTLAEFRAQEKLTLAEMAGRLGLRLTTLHGYLTGKRRPDVAACRLIQTRTGGLVTPADLRPDLAEMFAGAPPQPPSAHEAA